MFERFSEKALRVVTLAQEEARRLGHNFVGTEQILLGLIEEETGVAAKVLTAAGANLDNVRLEVEKIIGRGTGVVGVEIPFTPRVKSILKHSLQAANQLEANYIGTEHILLGLIQEGEGVAIRVLENLGVEVPYLRTQVLRQLGEQGDEPAAVFLPSIATQPMAINRIDAYLNLIQALLNCLSSEETEIWNANRELLDAGLVQTMEQAAVVMAEKGDEDAARKLRRFASFVAVGIGYSSSVSASEIEESLNFLLQVLQGVINSQGNPQVVYPILEANLEKLNENLAQILRVWAKLSFPLVTLPEAQPVAYWMAGFSALVKNFPQGDRSSNQEIAIAGFESALQVLTRNDFPRQWSAIQNDLGNAYRERLQGERSENIEKAIACYQLALQVRTQAALPEQWAMTQFNMGQAYIERIQGDRAENLEQATTCYENALQVFTPNKFPKESGMARKNLEVARESLRQGAVETPERAIQPLATLPQAQQSFLIEVLRTTWRSQSDPQRVYPLLQANLNKLDENFAQVLRAWATATLDTASLNRATNIATVIYHFSNLIVYFTLGDRAANLEIAIAGYETALRVYTRETFREQWAEIQINLGIAYEERLRGDQAEKWEQAITCYENAGQVFTRETSAQLWASVQENLGNAYRNRVKGDKEENLERAISYYENALQVFNPETTAKQWGVTKHNLGNAYLERRNGDQEENREKAITNYEEALQQVLSREAFPELWALTQMSLGNAYSFRLRGNPAENLQTALNYYQKSLHVYTAEAFPYQHQQVLDNLRFTNQLMMNLPNTSSSGALTEQSVSSANTVEPVEEKQEEQPFLIQVLSAAYHKRDEPQVLYSLLEANLDKLNQEFVEQLQEFGSSAIHSLEVAPIKFAAGEVEPSFLTDAEIFGDSIAEAIYLFSNAIQVFNQGNQEKNIEIAINSYQVISQPYIRQYLPQLWAGVQSDLGHAYYSRYQHYWGDRAENLELAIDCYQKALQVFTRESSSEIWAAVQADLGRAYNYRIRGDKAENQEAAIEACKLALRVYSRESFPYEWANTQNDLGIAYHQRCKGIKAQNLEAAIAAYQLALGVFTREAIPQKWAMVQMNLGNVYGDRIKGNKVQNLEQSIICFQNALEIRNREVFPQEWADTQINLGAAYYYRGLLRRTLDGAEDFEQAIKSYKNALQVYDDRDRYPERWSTIQHNLGITYSDRIKEDQAENLEQAIEYLKAALQVRTRKDFSYEWASTQKNLAAIYEQRILGKREENLELSIDCCEKALQVFTYENYPVDWATTQINLGNTYRHRIYGVPVENLEKAVAHCENTLQVFTRDNNPQKWAGIQFSLGTLYKNLGEFCKRNPEQNLEKAIECYQNALSVTEREVFPFQWAEYKNSLGNAYRHRVQGDKRENYRKAIACFQEAKEVHTRQAFPKDYVKTLGNIGNAHQKVGQLGEAYKTFKEAIETVESLRGEITSGNEAKRKLAEEWNKLYQWMVKVCLELGTKDPKYYAEALEYVERSKARNLVELLASRELPKGKIPETLWAELQQLHRSISAEQRILEDAERLARIENHLFKEANPHLEITLPDRTKLNQLQQQYNEQLAEAKRIDLNFSLTQQVERISCQEIQELLPDDKTAIIEWYILDSGQMFCTFVVTCQSVQPIVWKSTLRDLQDLEEWRREYLNAYNEINLEENKVKKEAKRRQWQANLAPRLKRLAEILHIEEILARVPKTCNQVILIPHRFLHLFPLHALPVSLETWLRYNQETECLEPATNPYLLDCFREGARYAPSCQLLQRLQQEQRSEFQYLFGIQNPTPDLYEDYERDLGAVGAIKKQFADSYILKQTDAKKSEILRFDENAKTVTQHEELLKAHCLFFFCHGYFELVAPLDSGLQLADECLTLGDIITHLNLKNCRLVTLSACETGLTDFTNISDEYLSLPYGFLLAGSTNVVSSLWKVSATATALLMAKFYEELQQQTNIAVALNTAQCWLRDTTVQGFQDWLSQSKLSRIWQRELGKYFNQIETEQGATTKPFESPYYWAAFCAIGKGV